METSPDKSENKDISTPEGNNEKIISKIIDNIEKKDPSLLKDIPNKEDFTERFMGLACSTLTYSSTTERYHEGPLPTPEILNGYNQLIPNGADRIMRVFENQSNHRLGLENKVVGRQTFQGLLGQIFAFVIAIFCLILGYYLVMKGHDAAGITIFSLDIVGLVYVFVTGKKKHKEDLSNKNNSKKG